MIHDMRTLRGHFLDKWVTSAPVREAGRRFGPPRWPATEDTISDLGPLPARVYNGLWIYDCPCGGAEMVLRGHPIGWCCSCGNRYAGGLWVRVQLPDNLEEIEALLDKRHYPVNQNWSPGETLDQLREENLVLAGLGGAAR